jgi:hypothetical protein
MKKAILFYPFKNFDENGIGKEVYTQLKENYGYEVRRVSMYRPDGNYKDSAKDIFDLIASGFVADFVLAMDYGPWQGLYWNKINFPKTTLVYEAGDEPQSFYSHSHKLLNSDVILTPDFRCNSLYRDVFKKKSFWWPQFAMDSIYSKEYDVDAINICVTTCGEERGPVTRYMRDSLGEKFVNTRVWDQKDHACFLLSGKIVFQESKHKEITRRLLEASALGRMVIADRPSEGTNYREFLKEDEEIVWYDSKEEAVEKTKYYLAHPEKAEKIGQNARRRVLSQHMCSNRVKNLIDILEENR